jgi:hypothetical protein
VAAQTLSVPAPAGPAEALPVLDGWLAEKLGVPPAPGGSEAWLAATGDLLRSEPALPLDAALARTYGTLHRLSPEQGERCRHLLEGKALETILPASSVRGFRRSPEGLYSFSSAGLHRFDGERWRLVHPDIKESHVYGDVDGPMFAGDKKQVYEIRREEAVPAFDAFGDPGPAFRWNGKDYLAQESGAIDDHTRLGLYERGESGWTVVPGTERLRIMELPPQESSGALYLVADHMKEKESRVDPWRRAGVYRFDGSRVEPIHTGVGVVNSLVSHKGKIYAATRTLGDSAYQPVELLRIEGTTVKDARPGLSYEWGVIERVGERLLALLPNGVHDLEKFELHPELELKLTEYTRFSADGDRRYLDAINDVHELDGGRWTRVDGQLRGWPELDYSGKRWVQAHLGRKWVVSELGVGELGQAERTHPRVVAFDLISYGSDLFFATASGVLRIVPAPAFLPAFWREALLERLGRSAAAAGAPSAAPLGASEGTLVRRGRSIFTGDGR